MSTYIGIDLGTTNSAICSYDGQDVKIFKSPEQHSVTPSAIYIDKRNRYYGTRAYRMSAFAPDNVLALFKRLMGTSTPIQVAATGEAMSPEQCSAEILKVLYSYLPDQVREHPDTGTVITVPAAFNQMQRDATLAAAEMAGIGKVALMQEPVAAVMSVMRTANSDGMFLVYDLGGGTFDIALAEGAGGRVSLLEHGGISMCGGRDFDRAIVDNVVKPWLISQFKLPENFATDPRYVKLARLAAWAAEQAKIELFAKEEAIISLPESEVRTQDEAGNEIYFDIPFDRKRYNALIEPRIMETVEATREVLQRAHLTAADITKVVFVGGPTQYKPLRDLVSFQLGIPADTQVDPMIAVAEGAAIFAESIDWASEHRGRKSARGSISGNQRLALSFDYTARTSARKARIVVNCGATLPPGTQMQVDSLDTGWSSGRLELKSGTALEVGLTKDGENTFKVFVFTPSGAPIPLEQSLVKITRTQAAIDAIPASHSLGIEVRENMAGAGTRLRYLVRKGDPLPHRGTERFKASESLRANGAGSLIFKLWEGEIEDPVSDNELVGCFKIVGVDFDTGVIEAGADLVCEYEVADSGKVSMSVSVPSVASTFKSNNNFYSRQEGQIDFQTAGKQVLDESQRMLDRVDDFSMKVVDDRLAIARDKLSYARRLVESEGDPESCKQGLEEVSKSKRLLAQVRREHLESVRQAELDSVNGFFRDSVLLYARPHEVNAFENMYRTGQRVLNRRSGEFEILFDQMRGLNWQVLWRQDWFVVDTFRRWSGESYRFMDKTQFESLVRTGNEAMGRDDVPALRNVVARLSDIRIVQNGGQDMMSSANII